MSFTDELFHSLAAISLQDAARLRPLTQKEKSALEQCEAKGGRIMAEIQESIKQVKEGGALPLQ